MPPAFWVFVVGSWNWYPNGCLSPEKCTSLMVGCVDESFLLRVADLQLKKATILVVTQTKSIPRVK